MSDASDTGRGVPSQIARLIGICQIAFSAVYGIVGLFFVAFACTLDGSIDSGEVPGTLEFAALFLGLCGSLIAAGMGLIRQRRWAAWLAMLNGLPALFFTIGYVRQSVPPASQADLGFAILMCGLTLLVIAGEVCLIWILGKWRRTGTADVYP